MPELGATARRAPLALVGDHEAHYPQLPRECPDARGGVHRTELTALGAVKHDRTHAGELGRPRELGHRADRIDSIEPSPRAGSCLAREPCGHLEIRDQRSAAEVTGPPPDRATLARARWAMHQHAFAGRPPAGEQAIERSFPARPPHARARVRRQQ